MRPSTVHLNAVLAHEAVTAPRQGRSQRTLERIIAALGELLREKPFDRISMAELAARSRCAIASIYARFTDKWAMIGALHASFVEDATGRVDRFLAPERWRGAPGEEIIAATVDVLLIPAFDEHRHLLQAVLLTNDPIVYLRAASMVDHVATRLSQVLPAPGGAPAAAAFRRRVRFAIRVVIATLERIVLQDAHGDQTLSDGELAKELKHLATSYLGYPQRRRSRPAASPVPERT